MDFVAAKMITLSRLGNKVIELDRLNYSPAEFDQLKENLKSAANYYKNSKLERNIWGNELAVVALSLDFTAVGLWIARPEIFKFFDHLNSDSVDRSILFCFLIIFVHLIIFLVSLIFKNLHLEKVKNVQLTNQTSIFTTNGFWLNIYKVSNNALGFIALTTSILIYSII